MDNNATQTVEPNELTWEAICHEAHEAYRVGRVRESSSLWKEANSIAGGFPAHDPRHCATLNNNGLVYFLDQSPEKSEEAFRHALQRWQMARDWTASMEVSGTARSSTFHHRLEVRHENHFKAHFRTRYCNWIDGGEAITAFNLSIVLTCMDRKVEGMNTLLKAVKLREQAFGETNPELALILRTMAGLSDDDTASANYLERAHKAETNPTRNSLERWQDDRPQIMNDTRRLLGAICMTAMLSERDFL